MKSQNTSFNSMLSSSLNDYTKYITLENSLLLANEKIKSLECLLASKDYVIYHMHMCNAYMAQSNGTPWRPPLPSDPPSQKESNEAADDCSQRSVSSAESLQGKSESAIPNGHLPKQVSQIKRNPAGDSKPISKAAELKGAALGQADANKKAILVESQMRQGGGGSRLKNYSI